MRKGKLQTKLLLQKWIYLVGDNKGNCRCFFCWFDRDAVKIWVSLKTALNFGSFIALLTVSY